MKKYVLVFILLFSSVFAYDVKIIYQDNKDGKVTPKSIEEEFRKSGFYISDNRDMNIPFKKQFDRTDFKTYNLFTLYHIESVYQLAKEYPSIGVFTPLSMSIYTKKGDDNIYVSFLTSDAISKITKIPADNKYLKQIEMLIRKTLFNALPNGQYKALEYEISKTKKPLTTKTSIKLDPKDWEEESEGLIEEFEAKLEEQGFVQASFTDINYDFKKKHSNKYDLFVSESICKLAVIYTVAKTRPEAGAFAPCSLAIYKKKGDDTLYLEYPNVYNWISSLSIEDKEATKILLDTQKKMEAILYEINE